MAKVIRQKDINFLLVLNNRDKPAPRSRLFVYSIAAIVLVAAVMAGFTLYGGILNSGMQRSLDELQAAVDDPAVLSQMEQVQRLQGQVATAQAEAGALVAPLENLDTYPDLTSADIRRIYGLAGRSVVISGFSYDRVTGVLSFSASSGSVRAVPLFLASLRDSTIFSDVSYAGYASGETAPLEIVEYDENGSLVTVTHPVLVYSFWVQALVAPKAQVDPAQGASATKGGD